MATNFSYSSTPTPTHNNNTFNNPFHTPFTTLQLPAFQQPTGQQQSALISTLDEALRLVASVERLYIEWTTEGSDNPYTTYRNIINSAGVRLFVLIFDVVTSLSQESQYVNGVLQNRLAHHFVLNSMTLVDSYGNPLLIAQRSPGSDSYVVSSTETATLCSFGPSGWCRDDLMLTTTSPSSISYVLRPKKCCSRFSCCCCCIPAFEIQYKSSTGGGGAPAEPIGEMRADWLERPDSFGIKFNTSAVPPLLKLMLLFPGTMINSSYFIRKCGCKIGVKGYSRLDNWCWCGLVIGGVLIFITVNLVNRWKNDDF